MSRRVSCAGMTFSARATVESSSSRCPLRDRRTRGRSPASTLLEEPVAGLQRPLSSSPMRRALAIVLSIALGATVEADPPPVQGAAKPAPSPESAASEVVSAFEKQDAAALTALAARRAPDPWSVVDELLATGAADAARKFADAMPAPSRDALVAYLATPGTADPDPAARTALIAATAALAKPDVAAAVAATEGVEARRGSILETRLAFARATALRAAGRAADAVAAFSAAVDLAEALG